MISIRGLRITFGVVALLMALSTFTSSQGSAAAGVVFALVGLTLLSIGALLRLLAGRPSKRAVKR